MRRPGITIWGTIAMLSALAFGATVDPLFAGSFLLSFWILVNEIEDGTPPDAVLA